MAGSRRKTDPSDTILDAALAVAAERGWRELTLADVAARAGLGLDTLIEHIGDRGGLLDALHDRIDRAVLAGPGPDMGDSARDRLFEVMMRRFDVLQGHREGMRAIVIASAGDPAIALPRLPGLARSMALMLEAAGISASGLRGLARVKGLALLYLYALRAWAGDDSADMARTMAALDKALDRAEGLAETCERAVARWQGRAEGLRRRAAGNSGPSDAPGDPNGEHDENVAAQHAP